MPYAWADWIEDAQIIAPEAACAQAVERKKTFAFRVTVRADGFAFIGFRDRRRGRPQTVFGGAAENNEYGLRESRKIASATAIVVTTLSR